MEIKIQGFSLKNPKKLRRLVFLLVSLFGGWATLYASVSFLENYLIVSKMLPTADALLVMAGSKSERIPAAALLYKKGGAIEILLADDGVLGEWSPERQRNIYQVEDAEDDLVRMKVPRNVITRLPYSKSGTYYDSLNCRATVLKKRIRSIVIVTSDYHTRRSLWSLEKVLHGTNVTIAVYPVPSIVNYRSLLEKAAILSSEALKYCIYRIVY